jgi:hypothetical protein
LINSAAAWLLFGPGGVCAPEEDAKNHKRVETFRVPAETFSLAGIEVC